MLNGLKLPDFYVGIADIGFRASIVLSRRGNQTKPIEWVFRGMDLELSYIGNLFLALIKYIINQHRLYFPLARGAGEGSTQDATFVRGPTRSGHGRRAARH